MAIVMRTLATRASAGSLVGAFNATDPAATPINQKIKALELAQPEGTLMELRLVLPSEQVTIPLVGSRVTLWNGATAAQHIANTLNTQYAQGKLKDPVSGEHLTLWPKPYHYPAAVAAGNVVTVRWVKLQAFAFILVGILVAALGYFAWHYLTRANWSLAGSTQPTAGSPSKGPPKILGIPWYYVAGAAVVVGVPAGYWYFSRYDREKAAYLTSARQVRALERGE